jgi:hypothetical protein
MKNEIKYKDYTICRWVAVFAGADICDEFDTMKEAKKAYKGVGGARFKYAAAEEINKDGDVNPAVYGNTLKEAMDKIKSVL